MSEKDTGFAGMAGPAAEGDAPRIGVGMLGYAFMGKAHTNGFKKIPYMMYPPPAIPELVAIAGRYRVYDDIAENLLGNAVHIFLENRTLKFENISL